VYDRRARSVHGTEDKGQRTEMIIFMFS
jgi:hypothetical protein